VGVYAQASKFAQLLWIIPGILAGLIAPALKNEQQKLTKADLLSVARFSFYIHLLLVFFLFMIAFIIYSFFLPLQYFNGFYLLFIMVPGYLLFSTAMLLAAYFSANRLLKINLYGSILCCALILVSDFILIPRLSYKGAAIANLLAYSITTFYYFYRSMSDMRVPFVDFFAFKKTDFRLFSTKILKANIDKA
jgi:O-antigen/teichoic acid export membrane protein